MLRIDALPFGSIDDKCEVRYLAGTLLAAEVKTGKATPPSDQAAKDWLAGQERTARLLLSAAAASTSDSPCKASAAKELAGLGADPDAVKPAAPVTPPAPPAK